MELTEKMNISIKDVADRAGASIATVSRVLNKTDYPVSEEMRRRVLECARELHYVPNQSARTLRMKTSNSIALIVRDIGDPYFTQIARGVTETAMQYDCLSMVFNSMQNTTFEEKYYQLIQQWQFSGVLIAGGGYRNGSQKSLRETVAQLNKQGIKIIALAPQDFDLPLVTVDNYAVGKSITQYLIAHGHRKIAYIGGYIDHISDEERLRGYTDALLEAKIPLNPALVRRRDFTWQCGYENCHSIMQSGQPFSAIFCSNDHIASGVINYLKNIGKNVPQDVSVAGVGNFASQEGDAARLTTVKFPFYEMGRIAVEMLLNPDSPYPQRTLLDTQIIDRNSVAFI